MYIHIYIYIYIYNSYTYVYIYIYILPPPAGEGQQLRPTVHRRPGSARPTPICWEFCGARRGKLI